jgi:hypothetical protein
MIKKIFFYLFQAGQEVPEFLKKYAEGGNGFNRGGIGGKNTDVNLI